MLIWKSRNFIFNLFRILICTEKFLTKIVLISCYTILVGFPPKRITYLGRWCHAIPRGSSRTTKFFFFIKNHFALPYSFVTHDWGNGKLIWQKSYLDCFPLCIYFSCAPETAQRGQSPRPQGKGFQPLSYFNPKWHSTRRHGSSQSWCRTVCITSDSAPLTGLVRRNVELLAG